MKARRYIAFALIACAVGCLVVAGFLAAYRPAPAGSVTFVAAGSIPGNAQNISVQSQPVGVLYDAANHRIYVANYNSESVSILNSRTDQVLTNISTHHNAWELALAPANEQLFVTNGDVGAVSIINTSTDKFVRTLNVGCHHAVGDVYAPATGMVYVECDLSSEMAVVNPATDQIVGHIEMRGGAGNNGIAIDPTTGDMFVANYNGQTVTVIDLANNLVVGNIKIGTGADGSFFDPMSNTVYVSMHYGNDEVLINATTFAVIGSINVGDLPHAAMLLPSLDVVLVTNTDSNNVSIIDASTNTLIGAVNAGEGPWGLGYDSSTQKVYVTDHWAADVLAIPASDF